MNREDFIRDDIKSYKKKFYLYCNPCILDEESVEYRKLIGINYEN